MFDHVAPFDGVAAVVAIDDVSRREGKTCPISHDET
jgi:hypothetical protein